MKEHGPVCSLLDICRVIMFQTDEPQPSLVGSLLHVGPEFQTCFEGEADDIDSSAIADLFGLK